MRKLLPITILLLALFALAACSDDDSNNGPGFAGPDLSGTWNGTWRDASIVMVLDQNGGNVTGTVTWGREAYDLTGTVSAAGVFDWGAVTPRTDDCRSMGSTLDDFQVLDQNTKMSGVARRNQGSASGDNPCGGRIAVTQGVMDLQRAF